MTEQLIGLFAEEKDHGRRGTPTRLARVRHERHPHVAAR
jgi:hypothetical protein